MHNSQTAAPAPSLRLLKTREGQKTIRSVALMRSATLGFCGLVSASAGFVLAQAFGSGSLAEVPYYFWWLILLGGVGAVACARAEILAGVRGAREAEKDLREHLLRYFFSAQLTTASKTPPARYISLMTDAVERATEYRQIYLGATLAALVSPVFMLLYITALDGVVGLGIFLVIPLVPATLWVFFRFFRKISSNSRARREALSVSYLDALRQLTLIRLYGAGERIEKMLRRRGEENRQAVMKLLAGNQLVIVVMDSVFLLLLVCWSTLMISWRVTTGALTTGGALSALFLLPLLLEPLTQVAGFFYIGMGGRASQKAITRVLAVGASESGSQLSAPGQGSATHRRCLAAGSAVSVRQLSHHFGRVRVLNNLSFDVPYGSRTAILGESGAGKSTLLSLVHGTLELQDGAVAVTGKNLRQLAPQQRPLLSALVTQQSRLFTGTIADNLRFALDDIGELQMWEALEQARIADEIRAMPAGLNTPVGEDGMGLSGGQVQRISLARALLTGRDLLLLDEPTSQVDADSEQKIVEALGALGENITLLMVTHRPALLKIADTVLTLDTDGLSSLPPHQLPNPLNRVGRQSAGSADQREEKA